MKAKLLTLISLLALLLVSTAVLADGRPAGIRIGRAVSGGGTNVQIDITVNTDSYYSGFGASSSVWIGNRNLYGGPPWEVWQYASDNFSEPLPWAIEWGDGYYLREGRLFGPPGGPFQGTFSHTYVVPGTYAIIAGDAACCGPLVTSFVPSTGNGITGYTRYVWQTGTSPFYDSFTFSPYPAYVLAITNSATVTTGTGIPTLNIFGLLAMAFVLVGTGLLVYRRPQRTVA